MHGLGSEPYALREYLPGDPIGKIHWKATARHGRPVTREDTWERSARLIVLLDCARAMASMDGRRSKLDYALAATLALTRVAAARGDQVTIVAFSGRVLRSVRVRSGGRGAWAAYEALYDVEAELAEPAYDLAAEAAFDVEPRSATAVLFTSVVDLAAAELLRESLLRLGRRHRALLLNLEDPELRALAADPPATPARRRPPGRPRGGGRCRRPPPPPRPPPSPGGRAGEPSPPPAASPATCAAAASGWSTPPPTDWLWKRWRPTSRFSGARGRR